MKIKAQKVQKVIQEEIKKYFKEALTPNDVDALMQDMALARNPDYEEEKEEELLPTKSERPGGPGTLDPNDMDALMQAISDGEMEEEDTLATTMQTALDTVEEVEGEISEEAWEVMSRLHDILVDKLDSHPDRKSPTPLPRSLYDTGKLSSRRRNDPPPLPDDPEGGLGSTWE